MLEGMAQAGGILAFYSQPENIGSKLLYFAGIDKARFRKPVGPGDQIIYRVEMIKVKRGIWKMGATASVDGQKVAQAELMASFG